MRSALPFGHPPATGQHWHDDAQRRGFRVPGRIAQGFKPCGRDCPMRAISKIAMLTLALLGGCGVEEVAAPAPGDISDIQRPATPNTFLAGPAGFTPTPDLQTRRFDLAPEQLFAAIKGVMAAQPRVTALADDPGRLRADYVVRVRAFGFPDIVLVQALSEGSSQSGLVVFSYSLKGYYDFGVNRNRVQTFLTALDDALAASGQLPRPARNK